MDWNDQRVQEDTRPLLLTCPVILTHTSLRLLRTHSLTSWIAIFQHIASGGWPQIMYATQVSFRGRGLVSSC